MTSVGLAGLSVMWIVIGVILGGIMLFILLIEDILGDFQNGCQNIKFL